MILRYILRKQKLIENFIDQYRLSAPADTSNDLDFSVIQSFD